MPDRPFGLMRDVDLAVLEPLDQVLRGKVDDLDIVGTVDNGIRYRFPHTDARDAGHNIVQAFHVLDVQRAVDVDSCREQLLHI